MDYPIKFTVEFEILDKIDLLEIAKISNYSSKYCRQIGNSLLDHLDIPTFVEVSIAKKRPKEEIRMHEDMPF